MIYIVTEDYGYGFKCVASSMDKAIEWIKDYVKDSFRLYEVTTSIERGCGDDNVVVLRVVDTENGYGWNYNIEAVEPL